MELKYLILLTLFCYSCLNMNDPDSQARYSESYNSFDKEMVNNIPKKLPNNQVGYGYSSPEYTNVGRLYLLTKVSSKTEFLELKTKFSKKALYSGYASDKCFAIVDGFKCNLCDTSSLNNCKSIFPIPQEAISYLEDITPSNHNPISKNYENAEIIIKECKLGKFLNIIDSKSNESESIKSKSGFSKGYTFVEKDMLVIYWTMNW